MSCRWCRWITWKATWRRRFWTQPGARPGTVTSAAFSGGGHIDVPFAAALNPESFTVNFWALTDDSPGFASVITSRDDFGGGLNTFGYVHYKDNFANWSFWSGTVFDEVNAQMWAETICRNLMR